MVPVPKMSAVSCLNDYRPVSLTPILMQCFEKLVLQHIKNNIPASLDTHQFAFRTNRSIEDAISTALHLIFTYIENNNTYIRMLFVVSVQHSTQSPPWNCGWIINNENTSYWEEINNLVDWCTENSLLLSNHGDDRWFLKKRRWRHTPSSTSVELRWRF